MPNVIARRGRSPLLAVHRGRVSPRAFPPERQAFLGIHSIKALFSHDPPLAQEQDAQPAVSKADPGLGELAHALPQRRERVLPASVVHRRSRRPDDEAGTPGADGVAAHQVLHDLTLLDGL
jgi:hypothetical protein